VADARLSSNVALLNNTQTFSGAKTFSTTLTTSLTGGEAQVFSGVPALSATSSLLRFGATAIASGSANGTYIGINAATGYTGDYVNWQTNGISNFRVTGSGAVTATGAITANSFSGNGSALTSLNGTNISSGTVANARLTGSGQVTVTAGAGLTGGGAVALGGSVTLQSSLGTTIEGSEVTNGTLEAVDFESTNVAGVGTNGYVLTYDNTTGGFTWVDPNTQGGNGVDSLNTFTGAVSIIAGTAITVTNASPNITIAVTADSITDTQVQDNSLTASSLAVDSVAASEIAANAVGTSELADTTATVGSFGNASTVATFTVDADGRLTASGSTAIAISGAAVTSGTVADARLSANVTLQGNTFNGASQLVQLNASSQLPAVSGALLTSLNGTQITSGTVADARLSSNVALLNNTQTFSGAKTFSATGTGLSVTNDATIGGALGVTGTTSLGVLNSGAIATTGNFSQTGATSFSTGTGANTLNGATTLASTLQVNGNTTLGDANTDTTTVRGLTTLSDSSITYPLRFGADVDLYAGTANRLDLATGDSLNLVSGNLQVAGTTRLTSAGLFQAANGTVGGPAYSFSGDTNTGMYWIAADTLGFSTGGVKRLQVTNTAVTSSVPLIYDQNSSILTYKNVHSYTDSGNPDTGTYALVLPKLGSNTMLRIRIVGYNYGSTTGAWEATISGFNYSSLAWINYSAEIKGNAPFSSIRLANNGTNNVILLGNTSTTWYYPKIVVEEVIAGYSNYTGWDTGWSSSFIVDESAIVNIYTPTVQQIGNSTNSFFQNGNSFGTAATIGTNDAQNLQFETGGTVQSILQSNGVFRIGSAGTLNIVDGAGDLYVQDELEVDGNSTIGGTLGVTGNVTGGTYNTATISGGTLSGGSVSGGTLTATAVNGVTTANIVLTSGSYADPAWITSLAKSKVGLSNVENTALSTWAGSANITTVGTIGSGVWNGTAIAVANGGTGATTAANARLNLQAAQASTGITASCGGTTTCLNSIYSRDSRAVNDEPDDRDAGLFVDFKQNTVNGLSDGGTYNGVLNFRKYGVAGDLSGGEVTQLAVTDNDNLWIRNSTSGTTWGTWNKFWHSGNDGASSTLDADLLDGLSSASFAPSTGSGSYIQAQAGTPGTAQNTNFNIGTGTGIAATLNATSAIQLNGTSINTGGTLSNVVYKDQSNTLTGATNIFQSSGGGGFMQVYGVGDGYSGGTMSIFKNDSIAANNTFIRLQADANGTPINFADFQYGGSNNLVINNAAAGGIALNGANVSIAQDLTVSGGDITIGADVTLSRGAANRLDIATGDSLNLVSGAIQQNATDRLTSTGLFQAANGTVGGPAYSFSGDTNTGMYWIAADTLGFATNGTERLRVTTTGASVTGNVTVSGKITQGGYLALDNDNLVYNGDFETNTIAGWTGITGTTTGGNSGNYVAQSVNAGTIESEDYIPVDPTKDTLQLEGYFKETVTGSTPGTLYFGYKAYNASKVAISTAPCGSWCYFAASAYNIPNDGNWHKFNATTSGEGTAYPNFPVGTKYVRVIILTNYGSVGGETTLFDHISIRKINNGPLYIGGDFTSTNQVNNNQVSKLYTDSSNNLNVQTSAGNGNIALTPNGTGIITANKTLNIATGTLQIAGSSGSSGQCLVSQGASAPQWASCNGGTSAAGWTDNGAVIQTSTLTDDVALGTATSSGKLTVQGDSDEVQLFVKGNATQTANIVTIQNSASSNLLTLSNSGVLTVSTVDATNIYTGGTSRITNTGILQNVTYQGNTIAVGYGGTGATTIGSAGAIAYSDGTNYAFTGTGAVDQCLAWPAAGTVPVWADCGDGTGAQTGLQRSYNRNNQITTTTARNIYFLLADTATDSNFVVRTATSSTSKSLFARADGAGTANGEIVLIDNEDANLTVTDGLKVTVSGAGTGAITDGLDVSDTRIINAINVGDNVISGTSGVIDFTNFDVLGTGATTINSTLNVVSALNLGNTSTAGSLTISDGTSHTVSLSFAPSAANQTVTFPADISGTVCLSSGNCVGVGGTGDILNNGQNGAIIIGSNNANSLTFETNNTNRIQIQSGGLVNILSGSDLAFNGTTRITNAGVATFTDLTLNGSIQGTNALVFEGSSVDANDLTITVTNPTGARSIALPNASGTFAVSASGNIALSAAGDITFTGQLPVSNGGTGINTLTANGILYGNGTSAVGITSAGTTGQCLVATTGSAPAWGSCAGGVGNGATLQDAYNNSSVQPQITTSDNKNLSITLADTTTDSNLIVNIANNSNSKFAIQYNSADRFALDVNGATFKGGLANLLRVQNAGGSEDFFNVDTTNRRVRVGHSLADANGTLLILDTKNTAGDPTGLAGAMYYNSSTNKFMCYGTAWAECGAGAGGSSSTRRVTLIPEYEGAILQGDGTNNNGTLYSGYVGGLTLAQGYKHNYYEWYTSQATTQDYDVIVNRQLPSDFNSSSEFSAGSWKVWTYSDNLTNTSAIMTISDADGTICANAVNIEGGATGWAQITLTDFDTNANCDFVANDIITITIKLSNVTPSTNKVRIGEIQYEYVP
jgi:hypothetical protein